MQGANWVTLVVWASSADALVPDYIKAVEPLTPGQLEKEDFEYAKAGTDYTVARSLAGYYWVQGKGAVLTDNVIVDFVKLAEQDQKGFLSHTTPGDWRYAINECPATDAKAQRRIRRHAPSMACDLYTVLRNQFQLFYPAETLPETFPKIPPGTSSNTSPNTSLDTSSGVSIGTLPGTSASPDLEHCI